MKRIKIGQIGTSHEHTSEKMVALRQLKDYCEVVGVVDDLNSNAPKYPDINMKCYERIRHIGISVAGSEEILAMRFDAKPSLYISTESRPFEKPGDFGEIDIPSLLEIPGTQPLSLSVSAPEADMSFAYCNRYAAVHLLCAIVEGREPISSGKDARWALEMIFGVYTSHLAGKSVDFESILYPENSL